MSLENREFACYSDLNYDRDFMLLGHPDYKPLKRYMKYIGHLAIPNNLPIRKQLLSVFVVISF